nr:MAG TPA: hypothetical protein [Caudoviricetes sp.]
MLWPYSLKKGIIAACKNYLFSMPASVIMRSRLEGGR